MELESLARALKTACDVAISSEKDCPVILPFWKDVERKLRPTVQFCFASKVIILSYLNGIGGTNFAYSSVLDKINYDNMALNLSTVIQREISEVARKAFIKQTSGLVIDTEYGKLIVKEGFAELSDAHWSVKLIPVTF